MNNPFSTQQSQGPVVNTLNQVKQSAQNVGTNIASSPYVAPVINTLSNVSQNVQQGIRSTLDQYGSQQNIVNASQGFLQTNSIIAKFVFVILVLIVFLFLLNIGITLIGYFLRPKNNPYLISGTINGNNYVHIPRDPATPNSVSLLHSNNAQTGMEFTWSCWLNIGASASPNATSTTTYNHIFNVGNNAYDSITGIATVNNGPGVYLTNVDGTNTIHIVMDVVPSQTVQNETVDITNIPFNKWVNILIRMENMRMDVYVNGVITSRLNFINVPRQNYGDVYVCDNGGFFGQLSNLRYYNYALGIFDITGVVAGGPSTTAYVSSGNSPNTSTNADYLATQWYSNKLGD